MQRWVATSYEGLNLDPTGAGLYAARIVSTTDPKKVPAMIGPADMQYDKATHRFSMTIPAPEEEVFYSPDPKVLELYIRKAKID